MNQRTCKRKKHGVTVVAIMIAAVTILLPIGLFAFEVSRTQMAQKQLRSATDSAALAAATFLSNATGPRSSNIPEAKTIALDFFKQNIVMSSALTHSTLSGSVSTDQPSQGDATIELLVDDKTGHVTVNAAYGLLPAFGQFLGLTTQTIRSHSLAGYHGLEGDIVIAFDISDSMTINTDAKVSQRTYNSATGKTTYTVIRKTTAPPTLGRLESASSIPVPETTDFSTSPLMSKFKDASSDVKLAALIEAKRGNLENPGIFHSSHADAGVLSTWVTPEKGYKSSYQKVAMQSVLPLFDAKTALSNFIALLPESGDAHLGLVTFGGKASDGADHKDSFDTFSGHGYPHVNLNRNDARKQQVADSLAPCLTFNGTHTKGAMRNAIDMLEGSGHRPGSEKTIILLTDGVPTTGSPKEVSREAGEKGIRLFAIGFFQQPDPAKQKQGKATLNAMCNACGNGSKMFFAPTVPSLEDVLSQIGHGTLALLNDD